MCILKEGSRRAVALALPLVWLSLALVSTAEAAPYHAEGRFLNASGGTISSLGVQPKTDYTVQFQVRATSGSGQYNAYMLDFDQSSTALDFVNWTSYVGGTRYSTGDGSWSIMSMSSARTINTNWQTLGALKLRHDGTTNKPITVDWDTMWTSLSLTTYAGLPVDNVNALTVKTGPGYTPPGTDVAVASPEGDSGTVGGVDFVFDEVTTGGTVSAEHRYQTDAGLYPLAMSEYNFVVSGNPSEWWEIEFDGEFSGSVDLTFHYRDESLTGREEDLKVLHQLADGSWEALTKISQDMDQNLVTVETNSFSPFVMGFEVPEPATMALFGLGGLAALIRRRRA